MAHFLIQPGAFVEINANLYILLQKMGDEFWQLEETLTKQIHIFTNEQLQQLYAQGELIFINPLLQRQGPPGLIAERTEIDHTSLDVCLVGDKTNVRLASQPMVKFLDCLTRRVLYIHFVPDIRVDCSGRA
jgi:hypothetical protein